MDDAMSLDTELPPRLSPRPTNAPEHPPVEVAQTDDLLAIDEAVAAYGEALEALRTNPAAILPALLARERVQSAASPAQRGGLDVALDNYASAILQLARDPDTLLQALLERDALTAAQQNSQFSQAQARRLVQLDAVLQRLASTRQDLAQWRESIAPLATAWWWRLDERAAAATTSRSLLWGIVAGTLVALTLPQALEIIRRLWDGAPDAVSVLGTLLALLLTGSPLLAQGREVMRWILAQVFKVAPRVQSQAAAAVALAAFLLVLLARVWGLPSLARTYNEVGARALRSGNVDAAYHALRRAVALDPDLVAPYQSLADVYVQIGRYEQAEQWYMQTIEHDRNFIPAYSRLGHLYNEQGKFAEAERLLIAGLELSPETAQTELILITRYEMLSDLGWAYFGQQRYEQAREALEGAVTLVPEVRAVEERTGTAYRIALPHFYLAQAYQHIGRVDDSRAQWEASLRFLRPDSWRDREQFSMAQQRLRELEGK
jgi:tetratricopeptide (TPR) repeat protein